MPTPTERLIELVKGWNHHDLVPIRQQRLCRQIGEELNAAGGISAMRNAYYEAKDTNWCAVAIRAYWDGIGAWRLQLSFKPRNSGDANAIAHHRLSER